MKFTINFRRFYFWIGAFIRSIYRQTIYRIIFSYLFFLFLFTALLMLPPAWKNTDKNAFSFLNSLYLTVSAFSTTGLTVLDISEEMTFYGQLLMLLLIVIGGFGLLFFKISIFYFAIYFLFGSRNYNYLYYEEQHFERGYILRRKTQKMLIVGFWYIIIFEIIGAVSLFFYFFFTVPDTEGLKQLNYYKRWDRSLWSAIFHAISATNNAGFDILDTPNSLVVFQNHYFVQFVFIFLFVLGGLGFPFFLELNEKFRNWRKGSPNNVRFSFFVKLSVIGYIAITLFGLSAAFIFEAAFTNDFKSKPNAKAMEITFNLLSTRSAGFSTVEINQSFTSPTKILMTGLMLIGSAPLSTGGGIKVTTFIILLYGVFGHYDRKQNLLIGRFAVKNKDVLRSFLIFFLAVLLIFLFSMVGSSEYKTDSGKPSIPLVDIVFDGVSALGNVGLSSVPLEDKGWTYYKISTILLMLIGQLGIGNFQLMLKRKYPYRNERVPAKVIL